MATACLWAMAQLQCQNGHLDDSLTCGHWVNMACPPKNGAFANARGCGVFAGVSPWPWRACRSPGRCPQPGPGPTGALGAPWFCSKRAGDGLALNLKTASQALNLAWTVTSNRCHKDCRSDQLFRHLRYFQRLCLLPLWTVRQDRFQSCARAVHGLVSSRNAFGLRAN